MVNIEHFNNLVSSDNKVVGMVFPFIVSVNVSIIKF